MTSNLAIAHGASIERAIGGSGNDRIDGNDANNLLTGNDGDDTLSGGAGADTLRGGAGGDDLVGGSGSDRADYGRSDEGVSVDLATGEGSGGHAEGDTLSGIERITGSGHDDALTGDSARNILMGRDGDDALSGGDGNDTLRGGDGADMLEGGEGLDWAAYMTSGEAVFIDLLAGTATGGDAEGDTLVGIERLRGSDHDDTLTGDAGRNVLRGDDGDDTLFGGLDRDVLRGDGGADQFVFDDVSDFDTVADFEDGIDRLVIDSASVSSFDDLSISELRGSAMIRFEDTVIRVRDVTEATLDADDFIFA